MSSREIMLTLSAAVAGLIYGLLHEIWDTSTAFDYIVAGASLVVVAILTAIPYRPSGPSPALAIPLVVVAWVAGVIGEFLAFLLGSMAVPSTSTAPIRIGGFS